METRSERAWEVVGPRFRFLLSVTLMTALAVVGLTAIPGILANGYPAQGLHRLTLERLSDATLAVLPELVTVGLVLLVLSRLAAGAAARWRRRTADLVAAAGLALLAAVAFVTLDLRALEQRALLVVALAAVITFLLPGWERLRLLAGWWPPLLGVLLLLAPVALDTIAARRARGAAASGPHVVVLMIDALRADHVTSLGYDRPTTPVLDALAHESVVFRQAVSNSNYTRATVTSFFTLLFPSQHGIVHHDDVLSDRHATLAEILRNAGYRTAAFIPNPNMKEIFNVHQGYHLYDNSILDSAFEAGAANRMTPEERFETAAKINHRALAWLDKNRGERTFLYLHYTDVHAPYVPPAPYDTMFDDDLQPPRPILDSEYKRMHPYQRLKRDGGDLNHYVARYDGEIRYADMRLGELLAGLEDRGVLDDTLFVVTADHGEAFLEHGYWEHAETLHDEMVHVPLVLRMPGGEHGGLQLEHPVHTFDVAATILDLAGIEAPTPIEARSLLPAITGDAVWPYSFLENLDRGTRALRTARWKLILNRRGKEELYDLVADPSERTNLVDSRPETAVELRALLDESIERMKRWRNEDGGFTELDEQTLNELRALGYVD